MNLMWKVCTNEDTKVPQILGTPSSESSSHLPPLHSLTSIIEENWYQTIHVTYIYIYKCWIQVLVCKEEAWSQDIINNLLEKEISIQKFMQHLTSRAKPIGAHQSIIASFSSGDNGPPDKKSSIFRTSDLETPASCCHVYRFRVET